MTGSEDVYNPSPDPSDEFAEYRPVIRAFARIVVKYGLTTPAVILLESEKPLNWIFSQGIHFFSPSVSIATEMLKVCSREEIDRFARFLEDRRSFSVLVEEIEKQEELRERLRAAEKTSSRRK